MSGRTETTIFHRMNPNADTITRNVQVNEFSVSSSLDKLYKLSFIIYSFLFIFISLHADVNLLVGCLVAALAAIGITAGSCFFDHHQRNEKEIYKRAWVVESMDIKYKKELLGGRHSPLSTRSHGPHPKKRLTRMVSLHLVELWDWFHCEYAAAPIQHGVLFPISRHAGLAPMNRKVKNALSFHTVCQIFFSLCKASYFSPQRQ